MTIRTGKSGRYRYYACSIKARQGETGCVGQAIPMEKLDTLVAGYIEERPAWTAALEAAEVRNMCGLTPTPIAMRVVLSIAAATA
jgi:hypothetical protein